MVDPEKINYNSKALGVSMTSKDGIRVNKRLWQKRGKKTMGAGLAIVIGLFAAILLVFMLFVSFDTFYDHFDLRLQSPVIIRNPIIISKTARNVDVKGVKIISPIPENVTPTPTKKAQLFYPSKLVGEKWKADIIAKSKYPKEIFNIWMNESTQGTNKNDPAALHNMCNQKGMTNEFGFYPSGNWCFKDFQQSVDRIALWFDKEAKGMDKTVAMCWYSNNGKIPDCEYNYNYLANNL